MKKRITIALALLLLLSGCDAITPTTAPTVTTAPPTTAAPVITAPPTTTLPETTAPNTTVPPATTPADTDFVRVADYIPDIITDLRYATENNFTGEVIYDFTDAYLRCGTVKKLMQVQEELRQQGLTLKIWDAFRPTAAQYKLWEVCPDPTYVADPTKGFSSHSRGNTLDITLCRADGTELKMPTLFDDFSKLADRNYSDCDPEAAANAQLLEQIMTKHGFLGYSGEWWHFSDSESYDPDAVFTPN